jgi:arsenite methyltransferase
MTLPDAAPAVQDYYGSVLGSSRDLRTTACCSAEALLPRHRAILGELPAEILDRFYGCGSPIPLGIEGCRVLDLGCGSGRDAYLLSRLVGSQGLVQGIDMTAQQIAVARRHLDSQMRRWSQLRPNLAFHLGRIEDLRAAGVEDDSMDVVVSNCVLNLATEKPPVFREIFRVLKQGGELLISDVFVDRRLPADLQGDTVLRGECLAGALYIEDFRRLLRSCGCLDFRVVSRRPIEVTDPEIAARVGPARFQSITVRAFKLDDLEDLCEDYNQFATYQGGLVDAPNSFVLDDHHVFERGRTVPVCGNTAAMLSETRLKRHFIVRGDRSVHHGAFACGPRDQRDLSPTPLQSGCC